MDTPIIIYVEKDGKEQSFLFTPQEDGSSTLQESNGESTKNFTVLGSGTLSILDMSLAGGAYIEVVSKDAHITESEQCNLNIITTQLETIPLGTIDQTIPLNIGDVLIKFDTQGRRGNGYVFTAKNHFGKIVAIDAR